MKYKIEKLGNLVELKQGLAINSQSNYLVSEVETSLSLLRIADMPTKRKVIFMSEKTPSRYIANRDDIIYTRTGQVGLVFTGQEGVVHNNCFRVNSLNEKVLLNKYLYWVLKSKYLYTLANTYAAGAAQPDLPHTSFKKIKIPLPDLNFQQEIANILSRYDEAIENNNKRIKLLEQMAQNLYKEWFVRFRFPGWENCEFENGIPKGWNQLKLDDIADIIMGQSPESCYYNYEKKGLPFHQGCSNYGEFYLIDEIYSTKGSRFAEPGSIIFSVRAPVGKLNITFNKIILGRGVAAINSKTGKNAFLYWLLKNKFSKEDMIGNGSVFASVTKYELLQQKFLIPPEDIIDSFDLFANNIERMMRTLYKQNTNLVKQRDLLLPRLMSGKLEVK